MNIRSSRLQQLLRERSLTREASETTQDPASSRDVQWGLHRKKLFFERTIDGLLEKLSRSASSCRPRKRS